MQRSVCGVDITNTGTIKTSDNEFADLKIRNFGGSSHYVIDVQGYWVPKPDTSGADAVASAVPSSAEYVPITPCRVLDTRKGQGTLANREIRPVAVNGAGPIFGGQQGGFPGGCGIPEQSVAVEVSVTVVSPADSGFFRAWPGDESMPNATFMNFDRGMDITNTGTIKTTGFTEFFDLNIRNFGGSSHYVIDVQGYYPGFVETPPD